MSRNRLANSQNMFQGKDLKVLCVCSAGLLRSPTMARLLSRNYTNVNPRAVGVSEEYALIPLDNVHLFWADLVLCADTDHFQYVQDYLEATDFNRDLYCLNIPDDYEFGDPELEKIIQAKFDKIDELKQLSRVE